MTEHDRPTLERSQPAEARPEPVETRVADETDHLRQRPDHAAASLRLGTVLLICLLLAAAAYIAQCSTC